MRFQDLVLGLNNLKRLNKYVFKLKIEEALRRAVKDFCAETSKGSRQKQY